MEYPLPDPTEIRHLYRLIHELCEMGANTHAWRERMQVDLEHLLDAHISVSYVMRFSLDPNDIAPKTIVYLERGTNAVWKSYIAAGNLSTNPVTVPIMQRFGTDFTVMRSELIADATWYASDFCRDVHTPSDMDDAIYSQVAVRDPAVVDGLGICRQVGKPRFTPKDVALVRFIHQELGRLWNREDPVRTHTLPARQREVLDGIRRGESRKTIAAKMEVSVHTVHTYEKALFERAGVASRGALLAAVSEVIRPNLLP
jgi:DNA-binding CsgD family transcriptional regulator